MAETDYRKPLKTLALHVSFHLAAQFMKMNQGIQSLVSEQVNWKREYFRT